jgi:N6-L-threonylcarbamoyladenine synthase
MINSTDFDFSFSGLKTAALYLVKKLTPRQIKMLTPAICAEFQQAVIDVLVYKTIRAARKFGAKIVMLSGGVAANELLRDTLKLETEKLKIAKNGPEFLVPPKNLCTDNAAMVAFAAYLKTQNKKNINRGAWRTLKARANLRIA